MIELLALIISCGQTKTVSIQKTARKVETVENMVLVDKVDTILFPVAANSVYLLKKDYDLEGKTFVLPLGVTIKIMDGVFKNGTLIGQNTKIEGKQPVFDKVIIKGDWCVPEISTKMFKDLSYDNSLRDVLALTNPNVINKVIIEDASYWVSIEENDGSGIKLCDNTIFILKGIIHLKPNGFSNYSIVKVEGENIGIEGIGTVCGDRDEHLGTTGEWGMGIEVAYSRNVTIRNITVKKCWGDCIYVGGNSKYINICDCTLDSSRRQGISVTSGNKIAISNCFISNINGTNPQYAIDIEPNEGEKVIGVTIENVKSENCFGGIQVWGNANEAIVENIVISNCKVNGTKARYPLRLYKANDIVVKHTDVDSDSEYSAITQYITGLSVYNNNLISKGKKPLNVINCEKTDIHSNNLLYKK